MNLTSGRQMKASRQRLNAYERQRLAFPLFCACVLTFSNIALSFVAPHKSETMTKKMNDHPPPPRCTFQMQRAWDRVASEWRYYFKRLPVFSKKKKKATL